MSRPRSFQHATERDACLESLPRTWHPIDIEPVTGSLSDLFDERVAQWSDAFGDRVLRPDRRRIRCRRYPARRGGEVIKVLRRCVRALIADRKATRAVA